MSSGLRIVQIVESLAVGGLEFMALNLAIAHRRAGHSSAIYTLFDPGPLESRALAAGVPVVSINLKRGSRAAAIRRIAQRLRAERVQIVHTHNAAVHPYGALAAKFASAVVVNTRHGLALHSTRRQELVFRAMLPLTGAVVFVCESARRHFAARHLAPEDKSRVILNGIPVEDFQAFPAAPGSRAPALRFGTIGRFVKAKAHHDLIEAFAMVAGELPEAQLEIWGYGELQPQLERQIVESGLSDRVRFQGLTSCPAEALQTFDVFVLSSISEGLPLVVLEAMAAGLPIVSTRVGGVPEVAPENSVAWYAEAANPASLATALRQAATADLAAAGRRSSQIAAQRFGVARMQQSYESLYHGLLRSRS